MDGRKKKMQVDPTSVDELEAPLSAREMHLFSAIVMMRVSGLQPDEAAVVEKRMMGMPTRNKRGCLEVCRMMSSGEANIQEVNYGITQVNCVPKPSPLASANVKKIYDKLNKVWKGVILWDNVRLNVVCGVGKQCFWCCIPTREIAYTLVETGKADHVLCRMHAPQFGAMKLAGFLEVKCLCQLGAEKLRCTG